MIELLVNFFLISMLFYISIRVRLSGEIIGGMENGGEKMVFLSVWFREKRGGILVGPRWIWGESRENLCAFLLQPCNYISILYYFFLLSMCECVISHSSLSVPLDSRPDPYSVFVHHSINGIIVLIVCVDNINISKSNSTSNTDLESYLHKQSHTRPRCSSLFFQDGSWLFFSGHLFVSREIHSWSFV